MNKFPSNCIIVDFQRRSIVKSIPVLLPRPQRGISHHGQTNFNQSVNRPFIPKASGDHNWD